MYHPAVDIMRHKTIRFFWQIFVFLVTYPLRILCYCIPKKKTLWVFANRFGFKDNSRYLFEYVREYHPEITAIWISNRAENVSRSGHVFSRFSINGLWLQYRANVAFVATGYGDMARFALGRSKVVQLWHGIPIKRILLDSPETQPFRSSSGFLGNLAEKIFRNNLSSYFAVISSSGTVQSRFCSAFGLPREKVPITGYPRHDKLLESAAAMKKQILYAPTWRSSIRQAFEILQIVCNQKFISEIRKFGYVLWLSIHPLNSGLRDMLDPDVLDCLRIVNNEDINVILSCSEILITDYSSIAIDFSLLGRKIIFFTPDSGTYFKDRGIYKEFKEIIMDNGVSSSDAILDKIADLDMGTSLHGDSFFKFHDKCSRRRIVEMVVQRTIPHLQ